MSIFNPKVRTFVKGRNKYHPSYYSRVTTRMGELVPVLCKKIHPSDRFRISLASVTRLAPLANPVYDRVRICFDAFYVQNRIIDPDFEAFYTGGIGLYNSVSTEGMQSLSVELTYSDSDTSEIKRNFGTGSLLDNLGFQFNEYKTVESVVGVPTAMPNLTDFASVLVKADKLLAYHKIVDDWYINERYDVTYFNNFIAAYDKTTRTVSEVFNHFGDSCYITDLRRKNYSKDPYTTALSEPLIGGPVFMPVNGKIVDVYNSDTDLPSEGSISSVGGQLVSGSNDSYLSLKDAVTTTIQELNNAFAVFRFFMTDTYNGNRYVEFVEAHFGVRVPDATLDRAIFLGRVCQNVSFGEIYQTSGTTQETNSLGDYAGRGLSSGSGFLFDSEFKEAGYIMIIMHIEPDQTYFQGVDNDWFIGDRFHDFYFPEFQNIGDEEVYTSNIWNPLNDANPTSGNPVMEFKRVPSNVPRFTPNSIFGYNRRNWQYLWYPNELHGNYLLDTQQFNWTFARRFESEPILGTKFNQVPNITNPFTFFGVDAMDWYTDIYFDIECLRQIDRYETFTSH